MEQFFLLIVKLRYINKKQKLKFLIIFIIKVIKSNFKHAKI